MYKVYQQELIKTLMPAEYEIWTVDHDPNIDVHKDTMEIVKRFV